MELRARNRDVSRANYLYSLSHHRPGVCVYCGDAADTLDHVYPISVLASRLSAGLETPNFIRSQLLLVPACRHCNNIAGSKVFSSFADKTKYIKNELKKRLNRLAAVRWDKDEIAELGHNLKTAVVAKEAAYRRLAMRVYWPADPPFFSREAF